MKKHIWILTFTNSCDAFSAVSRVFAFRLNNAAPCGFDNRGYLTRFEMTKDPDRARMERNLEDMMGEDYDWRLFRAKLIAQEKENICCNDNIGPSSLIGSSVRDDLTDKKIPKQAEQLGSLFAGALSSIFPSRQQLTPSIGSQPDKKESTNQISITTGQGIGGTPPSSHCEDPFASEEEIIAVGQLDETNERINSVNKHRWAHPISHIEPGCVLIANEKLGGVFHQTVVLIIDHHERIGSTGIVINRPLPGNLLKIASETNSNVDLSLKLAFNSAKVSYGGPVMQEDYSCLHGYGEVEGSKKVCSGVYVGGSRELMNEVRKHHFHPSDSLFVKGHAAWIPSQLSREVAKGVWYIASVSSDFILRYAGAPMNEDDNPNDLWSDILCCMGEEYTNIAKRYSDVRGDNRMP